MSHDTTFAVWNHDDASADGARRGFSPAHREVAFTHDYAQECDDRNGWNDAESPDVELHHTLITIGARNLSEFVQFVIPPKISEQGREIPKSIARLIAISSALHPELFITQDAHKVRDKNGKYRRVYTQRQLTTSQIAKAAKVSVRELNAMRKDCFKRFGFQVRVTKRSPRRR